MLMANYPEMTHRAFLINCKFVGSAIVLKTGLYFLHVDHAVPSIFPWLFNLVKGLMDERTRSKIFLLRSKLTLVILYKEDINFAR